MGGVVTIEIHSDGLDIVSSGARIDISNIEHEFVASGNGTLQNNVNIIGLSTYDITGMGGQPPGNGGTWSLIGPTNLGPATLSIEKTAILDTNGHDLQTDDLGIGLGNPGTGELYVRNATVTVSDSLMIGFTDSNSGRLHVGTGTVNAGRMSASNAGGYITGQAGGIVELVDSTTPAGTTYYVSSSHPARGDAGPGTQSQPFATFTRAVQVMAPGVTVLFRRGDSWSVANGAMLDINGARVGAYGSGARPVLDLSAGATLNIDDDSNNEGDVYDLRIEFGN